ncbi:MAG: zf-TFIIB domain-containing protein [Chloroflexi bacterium]|nr:zf-TFIIB domain-containing protein [Chloroflexota bacterium]
MTQPQQGKHEGLGCPHCGASLDLDKRYGIEMDKCPNDHGWWLDHHEMMELEQEAAEDAATETTYYARRESTLKCPVCRKLMDTFNYRANNVPIEFCTDNHGWWLDKGEVKQVMDLMRERSRDLSRSRSAQVAWKRNVRSGGKSFWDKLKDLFR